MHLVVIGGTGFVGRHFVASAVAKGHKVTVVSRRPMADATLGNVAFLPGGIGALAASTALLESADCVCHFATTTTPASSGRDPVADIEANLVETVKLLEAMRHAGNRRIVFLSSGGAVYGIPKYLPIDEDHPVNPISPYGVVKAAIEHYLRMYEATQDFRPTIIRLANPYGPGQNSTGQLGAVNTFLHLTMSGKVASIWGDGSIIRDYIHVSDVVRLLSIAVANGQTGTYNCGAGVGTSLVDLIAEVERVTGRKLLRQFKLPRMFDPPAVVLDLSRSSRAFDWRPSVSLSEGIEEAASALLS
jgi:UDP-glucose 4-epimerase